MKNKFTEGFYMPGFAKMDEPDMMHTLTELLGPGEMIQAAVYCNYKQTGFFANNRNITPGYVAITDKERIIGYRRGMLSDGFLELDMGYLTKVKISNGLLGSKIVYMVFNDGKKQEIKFQAGPKIIGGSFPNQAHSLEELIYLLKGRQMLAL